jgi:hypothetical protein
VPIAATGEPNQLAVAEASLHSVEGGIVDAQAELDTLPGSMPLVRHQLLAVDAMASEVGTQTS